MEKIKLAVLISGRGSNLQSLIHACQEPTYPAEIAIVISNKADAKGLIHATDADLPIKIINQRNFNSLHELDRHMTEVLTNAGVQLICLAGFMQVLSSHFVHHWWNKIINIHPSLLPSFKGLNVQSRAIASGARFSGCTIHYVREGVDEGPIICQAVVPILDEDDTDTLASRILEQEHRLYPAAVRWIATGQIRIVKEIVHIKDAIYPNTVLVNPIPI